MILMLKDLPVIEFDLNVRTKIIDKDHVPFGLRGRVFDTCGNYDKDSTVSNAIKDWLSRRVLPLSRENAKQIYAMLRLSQSQDLTTQSNIALQFHAVTLQDSYWVKLDTDKNISWDKLNLRHNSLNKTMAQVALTGCCATIEGTPATPEASTNGVFAKCWRRENGELYLYKRGRSTDKAPRIEIEVSDALDRCNVNHLHYEGHNFGDIFCSRCKLMADDTFSMLTGLEFRQYCKTYGRDYVTEALKIDGDSMFKMFIVDFLISNYDRHDSNWGFWYDNETMQILRCHPLFDHNNAFASSFMADRAGGVSQFRSGYTLYDMARYSMNYVDFQVNGLRLEDFQYPDHYASFLSRCEQLGIQVK